jgi:hypothetical protein
MELSVTPITPGNLDAALTILGNRPAFNGGEYRQFVRTLRLLCEQRRAIGRLISEPGTGRARVFGITTFVDESIVDAYLQRPHASIGKHVVLQPDAILDADAIARRNAGVGAQAVVIAHGYDIDDTPPQGFEWLLGTGMQAFIDTCRGFRLARIVNVVCGQFGATAVERNGAFRVVGRFTDSYPRGVVHTGVFTLTREDALATRNLLLPMFLYTPPRVRFTPSEQQIILAALDGRTDAELSRSLEMPMTAIKARWNRIHLRFFAQLPDLDRRASPSGDGVRGGQTRHIVLEYVRRNACELTPYGE